MAIEKNLVGSLITKPDNIPTVHDILKAEDFKDKKAGVVYSTLVEMMTKNEPIDLMTVCKKLAGVVDIVWLSESTDDVVAPAWSLKHAAVIAKEGRLDRIKAGLSSLGKTATDPDNALADMLSIYSTELSGDTKSGHISAVVARFKELITENSQGDYGLDTGYQFLEDKFIRYMPGHIWIIGAWTSVGKTATMVDMLCRLLENHDPKIAIISTEMMEEQNVARFLARQTGFHSQVMLSGKIHGSNTEEMESSLAWFESKEIYLYDNIYTLQDIEMRLRQLTMQGPIDVVFIDYIQNMTFGGAKSEYESKSEIAKGLQRIAKQLKTCIVCLSQVPNSAAKDDTGILEYKGAGEIAAVADLGIWLKRNKDKKEYLRFEVRKNRHGQTGQQVLEFVNNFTRLKEIQHPENE
jgi:replicative DNA helicase